MKTKTCPRCSRTLDVAEFNWRNRARDRLQPYCKACSRAYARDHYARNTKYYVDKAKARKGVEWQSLSQHVLTYLRDHPCVDCGETDPVVLEFDHDDPADKAWNVAHMIQRRHGWSTIEAEIAKCAVRCANCHRRRTARQFGWYRLGSVSLAPVAQRIEHQPSKLAVVGSSPSGRTLCFLDRHGAMWRSACDLMNLRTVWFALMAICVAVALAFWPPGVVRAAPAADSCSSGLPADVATQLEPLLQAL